MNRRAQSEVVGVVLLVGVVIIAFATTGAFVLSDLGGAETTTADLSVELTTSSLSLAHNGGDQLPVEDLAIVVRDGNRTLRPAFDAANITGGDDDTLFEPGERWVNDSVTFDQDTTVTVSVFDTRTNSLLVKETLYPDPA